MKDTVFLLSVTAIAMAQVAAIPVISCVAATSIKGP